MRAVVQRVREAMVQVDGRTVARIGPGLLVLVGVQEGDSETDASYLAQKVVELRVFEDAAGKMNLGLKQVGGELLAVSQFTLLGDCRKGRRPSFTHAAEPQAARQLFDRFVELLGEAGAAVQTGRFQEHMAVSLTNDGPVTLLLDSRRLF